MIDWLLSPLSGAAQQPIAAWAMWHARCMVLGWGLLLPLGVLAARFYKVTPRQPWPQVLDNPAWWHAHRGLQWAGIGVMSLGAALAWQQASAATPLARLHGTAGWVLVVAGWLQIAGGLARGSKGGPSAATLRGDHYDMSPQRIAFERLHKALGWAALLAAVGVIALGLVLADAPRWMALLLGAWWLALAGGFTHLQRRGRCIDTYQAIWGPDPRHPGNHLAPIGWGVRRPRG